MSVLIWKVAHHIILPPAKADMVRFTWTGCSFITELTQTTILTYRLTSAACLWALGGCRGTCKPTQEGLGLNPEPSCSEVTALTAAALCRRR